MRSCMVLKYIKRDEYDEENFRKSVIDNIVTQLRGDDPLQLGTEVGNLCTVHAEHTGVASIGPRECTLAHQCIADRSVDLIDKGL